MINFLNCVLIMVLMQILLRFSVCVPFAGRCRQLIAVEC